MSKMRKYASLLREYDALREDSAHFQDTIKDLEDRLESIADINDKLESTNTELEGIVKKLSDENDQLTKCVDRCSKVPNNSKYIDTLKATIDEDSAKIKELRQSLAASEEKSYSSGRSLARKNDQIEDLQEALQSSKDKYSRLRDEYKEAIKEAYERQRETERDCYERLKEARNGKTHLQLDRRETNLQSQDKIL